MLTHYVSHNVGWLWRLHSVHHGVARLYGFNGLAGHPLHLLIDIALGSLPLVLLGMPVEVGVLLGTAMTIQMIVQHSNVDYRLGSFEQVLTIGTCHRLHHVNRRGEGDVNFGLFFTIWDRALGTFRLVHPAPGAGEIGVYDQPDYRQRYLTQLMLPFVRSQSVLEQRQLVLTPRPRPAGRDVCCRRTDGAGRRFSISPTLCRNAVLRSTGRLCLCSRSAEASSANP
jgi:sterol desaturase/sphingolipid hydroxylase (fatty acid hydroxylase superfamily)